MTVQDSSILTETITRPSHDECRLLV